MKLIDLSECVFCDVSLYQFKDEPLATIVYKGKMWNVPMELMQSKIKAMLPQKNNTLGICIEREGEQ